MSALIAEVKVPAIKGGQGGGKSAPEKAVSVGKRGIIIISKEMVERLGIGAKDKFTPMANVQLSVFQQGCHFID
jgi:hypothetical protein